MANTSTDSVALAAVPVGGQIHEDLMDQIFDISPVDRPFCDATGTRQGSNQLSEWVREELAAADATNAAVEGDAAGADQSVTGERLGNYHQIASKVVFVSDRASDVNTVGSSDELIKQVMKRQKELRRDEEARYASRLVAVPGDGSTTASETAGVGAWIGVKVLDVASTTSFRGAGSVDPVLSNDGSGGGGYPTTAATNAANQALSETDVKSAMEAAYMNGGNPTMAMSTPTCIQIFSDYLFTSSARVAALQTQAPASNRTNNGTGGGQSGGGVTAQGAVNIFVTNFGTLELVPNRFQPAVAANVADLYLIDPETWERSYLQGYETNPLARDGTAEKRQITVDFALCALNPEGNAVVADIDLTTPGVA